MNLSRASKYHAVNVAFSAGAVATSLCMLAQQYLHGVLLFGAVATTWLCLGLLVVKLRGLPPSTLGPCCQHGWPIGWPIPGKPIHTDQAALNHTDEVKKGLDEATQQVFKELQQKVMFYERKDVTDPKAGDLVELKSGGPQTTVINVEQEDEGVPTVDLAWFDGDKMRVAHNLPWKSLIQAPQ